MTPYARLWLLEKAKADLDEAKVYEREAKCRATEMMQRQRGEDGWDPAVWSGAGTKAKRGHAKARKRLAMLRGVCAELEAVMAKGRKG